MLCRELILLCPLWVQTTPLCRFYFCSYTMTSAPRHANVVPFLGFLCFGFVQTLRADNRILVHGPFSAPIRKCGSNSILLNRRNETCSHPMKPENHLFTPKNYEKLNYLQRIESDWFDQEVVVAFATSKETNYNPLAASRKKNTRFWLPLRL